MENKILLTAGVGGMGGNQTWAMKMHGGVAIVVDADREILQRRIEKNYLDEIVGSMETAMKLARASIPVLQHSAGRRGVYRRDDFVRSFPCFLSLHDLRYSYTTSEPNALTAKRLTGFGR